MSNSHPIAAAMATVAATVVATMLTACSHDAYESGDGRYSYMRSDMVMTVTGNSKELTGATTDDGTKLTFDKPLSCQWATKNDSAYRALLYYNKVEDKVSPIAAQQALWLKPRKLKDKEQMHDDAVTLQSAWLSCEGKMLNLCLLVKTGIAEGLDAKQVFGCIAEKSEEELADNEDIRLTLFHNQNSVPEYYSSRIYATIPLTAFPTGHDVVLKVNTYDGEVSHRFSAAAH